MFSARAPFGIQVPWVAFDGLLHMLAVLKAREDLGRTRRHSPVGSCCIVEEKADDA